MEVPAEVDGTIVMSILVLFRPLRQRKSPALRAIMQLEIERAKFLAICIFKLPETYRYLHNAKTDQLKK